MKRYLRKPALTVSLSAIQKKRLLPPLRRLNHRLSGLLPEAIHPIFSEIIAALWPKSVEAHMPVDVDRVDSAHIPHKLSIGSNETDVDDDVDDEDVSLDELNCGLILLNRYPPISRDVWERLILKGPKHTDYTDEIYEKFWDRLINASERECTGKNAFTLSSLLLKTIHEIDWLLSTCNRHVDLLAAKDAKRTRQRLVGGATRLAKEMEELGINWSIWHLMESVPELAPASPRENRFIQQRGLGKVPDVVGLLEILARELDKQIGRSAIGQPGSKSDQVKKSAQVKLFERKLSDFFRTNFDKPLSGVVALATQIVYGSEIEEPEVRRRNSRAKKAAKKRQQGRRSPP